MVHHTKIVRIRSYSGRRFPAFGLNMETYFVASPYSDHMRENADQNNSEYRHFLRSGGDECF